jgi:Cys-tRNA(Pro)/Cys-tRNA(Cys) deacylase
MAKKQSAATPATEMLGRSGVDFVVRSYDMEALDDGVDTYGEAVAVQLGVEPERLFKTLLAEVDDEPVVAVVPVSERLSMKGLARAAGGKRASLMAPVDAERLTGYVTGGISPLGQRRTLPTFVDETIELFDRVCLSAGRRGLQVELSARDLIALLDATVADLT